MLVTLFCSHRKCPGTVSLSRGPETQNRRHMMHLLTYLIVTEVGLLDIYINVKETRTAPCLGRKFGCLPDSETLAKLDDTFVHLVAAIPLLRRLDIWSPRPSI